MGYFTNFFFANLIIYIGKKILPLREEYNNTYKFKIKYSHLTEEEIETVKKQETYREILDFNNISKI